MSKVDTFGSFRIRPIGGGKLVGVHLFREFELSAINGNDRTGVLSAMILRIGGAHHDEVMEDSEYSRALNNRLFCIDKTSYCLMACRNPP